MNSDTEKPEQEQETTIDTDAQQVVESLPAYQEFLRERNDESLTFGDI